MKGLRGKGEEGREKAVREGRGKVVKRKGGGREELLSFSSAFLLRSCYRSLSSTFFWRW